MPSFLCSELPRSFRACFIHAVGRAFVDTRRELEGTQRKLGELEERLTALRRDGSLGMSDCWGLSQVMG